MATVYIGFLVFQTIYPTRPLAWAWFEGLLLMAIALYVSVHNVILSVYRDEDSPKEAFDLSGFLAKWRSRGRLGDA
jgi:hypothetical protein